jgi:TrmH family RNA methyltransferase
VTTVVHRTVLTETDDFQLAKALLTNRKQRRTQRRFLVQGVRPISVALAEGWSFDSIWTPRGRRLSEWARDVIDRSGARTHFEAAPPIFAQLAEKAEPGELIATLDLPRDNLSRIPVGAQTALVICDRPASPGNLGAIVRAADAFGADGVVVTGHAADVYDPQTVRASVGAVFAVPTVHAEGPAQVLRWIRELRPDVTVIGTSAHAERRLEDVDLERPVALVFGNETRGLSNAWREASDELATIPMRGVASSLNLAGAAAVFLNELRRQRA